MPIENSILRNGRVLLVRYTGPFNATEAAAHVKSLIHEVYEPAAKPIYGIADLTGITQIRPSALGDGLKIMQRSVPNSAMVALVTNSPVLNSIARTLALIFTQEKVYFYRSLDEAWFTVDTLMAAEHPDTTQVSLTRMCFTHERKWVYN